MNVTGAKYFDHDHLKSLLPSAPQQELNKLYKLYLGQLEELQLVLEAMSFPEDNISFRDWAHKCTSSSLNIGAIDLGKYLSTVEKLLLEDIEIVFPNDFFQNLIKSIELTKVEIKKNLAS